MKKFCRTIAFSLSLSGMPVAIYAYGQFDPTRDGMASHWQTLPVPVLVDGGPLFGENDGLALVQQAVDVWNGVADVPQLMVRPVTAESVDFDLSNAQLWDVRDGRIRIVFDDGGEILSAIGIDPTGGILGVAFTAPDPATGAALAGVIVINGHDAARNNNDLAGTIVHEMGHILGLTHTPVGFGGLAEVPESSIPTMFPFAGGVESNLEADDIAGIRAIYGQ